MGNFRNGRDIRFTISDINPSHLLNLMEMFHCVESFSPKNKMFSSLDSSRAKPAVQAYLGML